jgi:pimeloyl-ACP methyl ester carboxylesterase
MRRTVPALLALAAIAPSTARAATSFTPCRPVGFECATVDVPLDRTGAVPGAIPLAVVRARATDNPTRSAVVALAGGPGQAADPLATDFALELGPALANRDLLLFDSRGTGGSAPLSCPTLKGSDPETAVLGCARHLGAPRGFFRTADTVQDLEAVRQAGGYDHLTIYGVSYGTKVALQYAAAHPDRVERLILDSVVTADGPDPFRRSSFHAVPRMLRDLCANSCRRFTRTPAGDLATLARRLAKRRLRGHVIASDGRRRADSMGQADLFAVLLAGDLNPALRSELPGAIRSALRHDPTPLLRLHARGQGLGVGDQPPDAGINSTLFFTTTCEDASMPWPRGETSVRARVLAAARAARDLPPTAIAPFNPLTALTEGFVGLCLYWPAASPEPVPTGGLPAVPTLVVAGGGDLRTPVEDARSVVDQIPGAQLLVVPRTGHSVLGADLTSCTRDAVVAFFAGNPVSPCRSVATTFTPIAPAPTRVRSLPRTGGLPGLVGRTMTALRLTVRDLSLESIGVAIAQGRPPRQVGGLRAGHATRDGDRIVLRGLSYVPGVSLSGVVAADGAATLRVGGRAAAHGTVRISGDGHATGTLGGRRVAVALAGNLRPRWPRLPGPLARVP